MKEQTEKITKKITGGVLGAALGLSLSLLFLPLEVQAAKQCTEKSTCVGYKDSDVEHDHSFTLKNDIFYGGTAKEKVFTEGDSVIKNGTFQHQMDVYGTLTIENGDFLSICVYGDATIKDGTFGGIVTVSTSGGYVVIQGGTFESNVQFGSGARGGNITGGVFKGKVELGGNVAITGGTFLEGVWDSSSNMPYNLSGFTYNTITLKYSDGREEKQLVFGSSTPVNPNGSKWLKDGTEEVYDFRQAVTKDLTLIEEARASEGGGGAEAEQLPEGGHTTCEYEWVTVREAGAGVDGEEWYQCKLCGRVESVQIIPAASYQTARLYEAIGKAQEAETITYDLGNFHTITDTLLTTLQNRSDVTLVLTFTYQNRCYETTFPKGTDYTELLEDEDFFYGLLGLNGRSGIVTQDVTP